ncbi:hypothetical protein P175DRAFT_0253128 [Aspergillus ochraceoroseus IBT 24754]|uniref:HD domain-containing protein n=3 Tax=Aspergillus subgen. Nidulantes TaxID=2720870 RepID=A0A0F8XA73_9EURO|nr:uncharacterized protein P175DRAFT_0253128 [Aspergillus ochraceoroseus IBT 24754]KKK20429.1 hypothetical protein AOCH_005488 [Aspergillus ochraceoroseus]KKK20507.1 hypothetical protein ARAM_001100 [Aspergillus rambellii]PTU21257.1 hypothetical protein P175DRAFT_0253128 [Aspergillus ochraceoroseus IBT 24754]
MASTTPIPLPSIPDIHLVFPESELAVKAFAYAKQHCTEAVYNHAVRSAYWALIIANKVSKFKNVNFDFVVVCCILHDMGWSTTAELLSEDKRFEVDGANIARDFISTNAQWSASDIQHAWNAIALHATPSIAKYAAPDIALIHEGIAADFFGPTYAMIPGEPGIITLDEYYAVMKLFPRAGFNREGFKNIGCWLCRTKPRTTYDNWVGQMGLNCGIDGNGEGREEYERQWKENQAVPMLFSALDCLEAYDQNKPF